MRRLGRKVLKHLGAGFRSAKYITSLEDIDFTSTDRLLFTFSYVAHQRAVRSSDLDSWASLSKRAVNEVDRDVELIYTTSNISGGAHLRLRQTLRQVKILKEQHPIDVQVRRRFPGSTHSGGRICWDEQPDRWVVQAEHWVLSA